MYQPTRMLMPLIGNAAAQGVQLINSITGIDTGQIETDMQQELFKKCYS